jgi:hypothetical protein
MYIKLGNLECMNAFEIQIFMFFVLLVYLKVILLYNLPAFVLTTYKSHCFQWLKENLCVNPSDIGVRIVVKPSQCAECSRIHRSYIRSKHFTGSSCLSFRDVCPVTVISQFSMFQTVNMETSQVST